MRRDRRVDRRERREDRRERRRALLRRILVSTFGPDRGPAGTKVVIRGRNFGPDVKVAVGGVAVDAKIKDNRIVFKVPKGAGDGAITLTGPGGRTVNVGFFDYKGKWDRKAHAKRRQERRKRARDRWLERRKRMAKTAKERREAFEAAREERARTRDERRRKRAEELRARWQRRFLAAPEVQAELALHAERKARLLRMRRLADIDAREKLVLRIEVLLDREDERHEARMELLKKTLKI
jgi:hypothetical protein